MDPTDVDPTDVDPTDADPTDTDPADMDETVTDPTDDDPVASLSHRATTIAGRLKPGGVGLLVAVIAVVFVAARLFVAAEGDISRFILAGTAFTDASATPGNIHVFDGPGNDGQFNYRFALDPTELGTAPHLGITVDLPLRSGRIGYPALAWVLSLGGRPELVPAVLVGLNVVGLALLGWFGALLAQRAGHIPAAGLLLPGWFGFLFSLSRDYGDIVGAAAATAAITLTPKRHPVWYGLLLSFAALTRELYMALAAGLVLERIWSAWKARSLRPASEDLAWVIPAAVFAGWQYAMYQQSGVVVAMSGSGNQSLPLEGLLTAARGWLTSISDVRADHIAAAMAGLSVLQFLALLVFAASVIRVLTWPGDVAGVVPAWVALALLSLCLSADVWGALNDFRNLSELAVLGTVLLICSRRSLGPPAGALGVGFVATVLPRVLRP